MTHKTLVVSYPEEMTFSADTVLPFCQGTSIVYWPVCDKAFTEAHNRMTRYLTASDLTDLKAEGYSILFMNLED